MTSIVESYRANALARGGLLLFQPNEAMMIVAKLEQARVRVLGIDAFHVTPTVTQPLMEHSIDLAEQIENNWSKAKTFLDVKKQSGLLFEIVADE